MAVFSFGSDPELMLADQKGRLQSAVGIVHGDPENRISMEGHSFYHDNVLAECAIRPAKGKKAVLESFRDCFCKYAEMVKPYRLIVRASAEYPADQLLTEAAQTVGCHPEACAYTLEALPKPEEQIQFSGFRSAGGHIHLGVGNPFWSAEDTSHYPIKMMDLFLGIPSLFLDHDPTSKKRRTLYGVAGSHRRKDYGVEYRPLSNFWIASPKLVALVYDICEFIVEFVNSGKYSELWVEDKKAIENYELPENCYICTGYNSQKLRDAINTSSKAKAKPFLSLVEERVPKALFSEISKFMSPAKYDFYKEWSL